MMKMYVWSNAPFWLAVAQAESVDAARRALLDTELGDSGDGSCPVHDKAREMILGEAPTIWYGPNAEFAITDSAAVEEAEAETAKWKAQLDAANRRIAELEGALRYAERMAGNLADLVGNKDDALNATDRLCLVLNLHGIVSRTSSALAAAPESTPAKEAK